MKCFSFDNWLMILFFSIFRSAQSGTSTPQSTASLRNNVIPSDSASIASDDISDAASDIEQLQIAVNVGVQMLSETIEEDLTQLHHLRVVSSALNADFRNDLERLVQVHILSLVSSIHLIVTIGSQKESVIHL